MRGHTTKIMDENKHKNAKWFQANHPEVVKEIRSFGTWLLEETELNKKPTLSLMFHVYYYNIHELPKCSNCGSVVGKTNRNKDTHMPFTHEKFNTFCSYSCASSSESTKKKRKHTLLCNYGVDNPNKSEVVKNHTKETVRKKYGVDNISSHEDVKKKRKNTFNKRYGDWVSKVDEIKERTKQTNLERYGYESVIKSPEVQEKMKQTNLERYGVENPLIHPEVRKKAIDSFLRRSKEEKQKTVQTKRKRSLTLYGCIHPNQQHLHEQIKEAFSTKEGFENIMSEHNDCVTELASAFDLYPNIIYKTAKRFGVDVKTRESYLERDMRVFLDSLDIDYQQSVRNVLSSGREIDFYIESRSIGIEMNGLYWHSAEHHHKNYHQEKSLECIDHGIQLIHIWEDDWNDPIKKEILKNKIRVKLGLVEDRVYARKSEVVVLDAKEARAFYNTTHIQGSKGATIHLGLVYSGETVAVVSFLKTKKKGQYDMVRFSTSTVVVGGFSKLLSFFKKNYEWNEIFTFAHLDYSRGDVYEKTGFEKTHTTKPNYFYSYKGYGDRVSRNRCMKHRLSKMLNEYDESLSEYENMKANGFVRIYDAGSIKYILHPS